MTTRTTFLGTGAMGSALAVTALDAGRPTVVWNRTPHRAGALGQRGATVASTVEQAVAGDGVLVACLYDHQSVHEVLDPVVAQLTGRTLINLTTTTPNQSRELAAWAHRYGIDYLDGGIMAIPDMIGRTGSAILYSGSTAAFEAHRDLLDLWGESSYYGADAGMAALYDLAMLAGMYVMFAGFMHGAAMVGSEGVSATEFAAKATPFLSAMTGTFAEMARIIDAQDYTGEGQQSLEFSDLGNLMRASLDQGVNVEVLRPVHDLIRRQIDAGYGEQGLDRIFEELRSTR